MNRAQRVLVVVALGGLAAVSPIYCLEYRAANYWTSNGVLFDKNLRAPAPVLTLSETELAPATAKEAGIVHLTGLYARHGLAFQAALLGGLLGPIIFLVAAGYIALAGNWFKAPRPSFSQKRRRTTQPAISSEKQPTELIRPPPVPHLKLYRLAAIVGVVAPVLWVLDLPAMLLMMNARFPRWVFALLVIDAMRFLAR